MITATNVSATALLALCAGFAHADLTAFTSRADFDAATGLQAIEDFESEALGQFALPAALDSGLSVNIFNGSVSSFIEAGDPDDFGFKNTTNNGRKYLRFGDTVAGGGDETGSYSVDFTFGATVRGFGFDLSGFQPDMGAGGFNISLFSNGQFVEDFFVFTDQAFGEVAFYGFTRDQGFDTARVMIPVLNPNQSADYVAFDDVTWSTVPSPAGVSVLSLAGLAAARRRRAS